MPDIFIVNELFLLAAHLCTFLFSSLDRQRTKNDLRAYTILLQVIHIFYFTIISLQFSLFYLSIIVLLIFLVKHVQKTLFITFKIINLFLLF